MTAKASFSKSERLKSRKAIQLLFEEGESAYKYPIKIIYRRFSGNKEDRSPIKASVSVSKRLFKKAVDRNRIKRQLRELYRLHKVKLLRQLGNNEQMDTMLLYVGKQKESYQKMEKAYLELIDNLL